MSVLFCCVSAKSSCKTYLMSGDSFIYYVGILSCVFEIVTPTLCEKQTGMQMVKSLI